MNKLNKQIILSSLFCILLLNVSVLSAAEKTAAPKATFDSKNCLKDTGKVEMSLKSAEEIADEMKVGWNLGNTLDATGARTTASETSWSQPLTTKEMITKLAESGITTIRIPVSYHNHMDRNYTIDVKWMSRVKEIVDWAIDAGLYVVINTHHDVAENEKIRPGDGYYPSKAASKVSCDYIYNAWMQIATAFNNGYDEHLIFEIVNEPRLKNTNHEWWFDPNSEECLEAADCIKLMEETGIKAIRSTGGNNASRIVIVTPYCASPDSALNPAYELPEDSASGRMMISAHMYSPYDFAMQNPGTTVFTGVHKSQLSTTFSNLAAKFSYAGVPVFIGETGATNKNNLEEREKWFSYFFGKAHEYGMPACIWDNNNAVIPANGSFEELYGFYNRIKGEWYFDTLRKAAVEAMNN